MTSKILAPERSVAHPPPLDLPHPIGDNLVHLRTSRFPPPSKPQLSASVVYGPIKVATMLAVSPSPQGWCASQSTPFGTNMLANLSTKFKSALSAVVYPALAAVFLFSLLLQLLAEHALHIASRAVTRCSSGSPAMKYFIRYIHSTPRKAGPRKPTVLDPLMIALLVWSDASCPVWSMLKDRLSGYDCPSWCCIIYSSKRGHTCHILSRVITSRTVA